MQYNYYPKTQNYKFSKTPVKVKAMLDFRAYFSTYLNLIPGYI